MLMKRKVLQQANCTIDSNTFKWPIFFGPAKIENLGLGRAICFYFSLSLHEIVEM